MRDYKHDTEVTIRAIRRFLPQVQIDSYPGDGRGRLFSLKVPESSGFRHLTCTAIGRREFLVLVSAVADVLAHLEATGRLRQGVASCPSCGRTIYFVGEEHYYTANDPSVPGTAFPHPEDAPECRFHACLECYNDLDKNRAVRRRIDRGEILPS